jgi:hypothetical protein
MNRGRQREGIELAQVSGVLRIGRHGGLKIGVWLVRMGQRR